MMTFFRMLGFTEEEARNRFWLIDTKGLITNTRYDVVAGKLASHKEYFIRNDTEGKEFKTLAEVVEYVKPTALVGLSTTYGAFGEDVVRRMADLNPAPIIFPLSNPTSKCELSFEDALNWTDGKVLFASGSPYDPITYKGQLREPGQGVSTNPKTTHIPPNRKWKHIAESKITEVPLGEIKSPMCLPPFNSIFSSFHASFRFVSRADA